MPSDPVTVFSPPSITPADPRAIYEWSGLSPAVPAAVVAWSVPEPAAPAAVVSWSVPSPSAPTEVTSWSVPSPDAPAAVMSWSDPTPSAPVVVMSWSDPTPAAPAEVSAWDEITPPLPVDVYAIPDPLIWDGIINLSGIGNPVGANGTLQIASALSSAYPGRTAWSTDGTQTIPGSGAWARCYALGMQTPEAATLEEIYPPENYVATGSQSTASQLIVRTWPFTATTIYWLYDAGGGVRRWVSAADAGLASQDATVIPAGRLITPVTRLTDATLIGGKGDQWEAAESSDWLYILQLYLDGVTTGLGYWGGFGHAPYTVGSWIGVLSPSGYPVLTQSTGVSAPAAVFATPTITPAAPSSIYGYTDAAPAAPPTVTAAPSLSPAEPASIHSYAAPSVTGPAEIFAGSSSSAGTPPAIYIPPLIGSPGMRVTGNDLIDADTAQPVTFSDLPEDVPINGRASYAAAAVGQTAQWNGTQWVLNQASPQAVWTSTANVATPDLVPAGPWHASTNPTGWRPMFGTLGTPTLTAVRVVAPPVDLEP